MAENKQYDFYSNRDDDEGDDEMQAIKGRAMQKDAPALAPPPAPPGRQRPVPVETASEPEDEAEIEQEDAEEPEEEPAKSRIPFFGRQKPAKEEEEPEQPVEEVMPAPAQEAPGEGPPLFIKVDRYKEIVKNVQQLRSYVVGLRDALDALSEMEKEIRVGIEISHKALDRLNIIITFLDTKFLRLQGLDSMEPEQHSEEIENYVKGVHEQMERLKKNLRDI